MNGSKFINSNDRYSYGCSTCKILINGLEVSGISTYSWYADNVSFTVPSNAASGYVQVQDANGNLSNKLNFTITTFADQQRINITSISPTTAIPGKAITINGSGFGIWDTNTTLTIGGIEVESVISWSETSIQVPFPLRGQFGQKVKIKKCKYSYGISPDDCVEAVSSATIIEKKYSEDKYSGLQWYLENTSVPQAWKIKEGSNNVIVAVIDSGVDTNHEDFTHAIWLNKGEIENNGIDDDHNGYIDDKKGWDFVNDSPEMTVQHNHGTAVAGLIAAKKDNKIGIAGIAPNVKIMVLTVLDKNGSGNTANIKKAIKYAVDNGANIINLSLGGLGSTMDYDPNYDAIFKYAYDHNVLVIASAGNGDILGHGARGQNLDVNPSSPVCNDGDKNLVIGVGATDENNQKTSWSNYGKCVDVWAPGVHIVTTAPPPDNYAYDSGTSFSAPIVSGVAALVKSLHPDWNVEEIKAVLINSQTNGVIDAYKAVTASKPNVQYQPLIGPGFLDTTKFQDQSFKVNPDIGKVVSPAVEELKNDNVVFPDIEGEWNKKIINYLKNQGIVNGYSDGTYRPKNPINRAEFVKIIVSTLEPNPTGSDCFKDVQNEWFSPFVCYAKQHDIIRGYKDGNFKPNQKVNLVEALKITFIAFKVNLTGFKGENWYDTYMNTAKERGWLYSINGDRAHDFTRGEMADLIYNIKFMK